MSSESAAHGSFQEVVHAPLVGADPDECSVDTCGAVLRSALEYLGAEAHVTTEKPLVAGSHPPVGMECPRTDGSGTACRRASRSRSGLRMVSNDRASFCRQR